MTSRKITIDNSVKYIPQSEQRRDIKPNMLRIFHFLKNKTKNCHNTIKNSLKIS